MTKKAKNKDVKAGIQRPQNDRPNQRAKPEEAEQDDPFDFGGLPKRDLKKN